MNRMPSRLAALPFASMKPGVATTYGPFLHFTFVRVTRTKKCTQSDLSFSLSLHLSFSHPMYTSYLGRISAGESLTRKEMALVMSEVMAGRCRENEIALLLTALKAKQETAD